MGVMDSTPWPDSCVFLLIARSKPFKDCAQMDAQINSGAAVARLEEVNLRIPLRLRQQERIRALHEINLAITSTLELQTVLDTLLEEIDLFFHYATASIVRLFNGETGKLEPVAFRNLDEEKWRATVGEAWAVLSKEVVETKNPLIIGNVQTDRRTRHSGFFRKYRLVSYLGLPLIAKGKLLGVLDFYTKGRHGFEEDEVEFLAMLSGQAAIAIHNSQLYEQTKRQALELERTNRLKSEILSIVSHEVKTPLTIIMGYSEIIKEGILPEYDKALTRIRKHCAELATIIDSLLTAARIEAGASSVESQEVHLGDFLNKLRSLYDIPLDKELTLVWDYPSELPLIKTDSGKLKHILQNLVNNAIKFTEKGLVTISAQIKAGSRQQADGNKQAIDTRQQATDDSTHASRLSPQASGRYVELKVADTGIGIPKEKISIIFEMFGQVDSSKTRSHGGVGLGLYIVKTFTEMLGGKIDVESESGKGSAFTVTIPCESQ